MVYAASRYQAAMVATQVSPREVEASAFAFVNTSLLDAEPGLSRVKALGRAHKLWSLLLNDVASSNNALPEVLKGDVVKLGVWAMRFCIMAMGRPDMSIRPLIDVNQDMIDALRPPPSVAGSGQAAAIPHFAQTSLGPALAASLSA